MTESREKIEASWLTIDAVKKYAGVGRTSIYAAIKAGRLEARRFLGRTVVSKASVDELIANSPRLGDPK